MKMQLMISFYYRYLFIIQFLLFFVLSNLDSAFAHEVWLLTPEDVIRLNQQPIPTSFMWGNPLSGIILAGLAGAFLTGYLLEIKLKPFETHSVTNFFKQYVWAYLPLIVRFCVGITLLYAGMGWNVRHGAMIDVPTLFVPDLSLSVLGGMWQPILAYAQIAIALCLFLGIFVRICAVCIMILTLIGAGLFGQAHMVFYTAHFIMPALYLLCVGAGDKMAFHYHFARHSLCDRVINFFKTCDIHLVHQFMLVGTGIHFALLGLFFKFLQPNLIIHILSNSNFPLFGIPVAYMALMMGGIEIIAGICLAMGILVRFVSIFLIGAMCSFAFILDESLILHGNIFALMLIGLCYGSPLDHLSLKAKKESILPKDFPLVTA